MLRAHPDKGGKKEDTQRLQAAREEWEKARKVSTGKAGRPSASADEGTVARQQRRKEYRVQATVVLLTYNNFADLAQWHRFVAFARDSLKKRFEGVDVERTTLKSEWGLDPKIPLWKMCSEL